MRKVQRLTAQGALIYARVSSKEQEKEGFSIPAQLKLLRQYAMANGFRVEHEYVDVETAKKSGRTAFVEMLRFLGKEADSGCHNYCKTILVEKTDRLYRNLKDWVSLDELELEIHFVKENVILSPESKSSEKFMHGTKVLMAKNYIDNLSEETKKGMQEKAEQGIYPSNAPLGYMNVVHDGKRLIALDPEDAQKVCTLFEWYASGNYSLKDISKKAYQEGLVYRKSGRKIPKSVVHSILKNPIYYGEFLWNGKSYAGTHEPIVSRELFDRVQDVLEEKGKRPTGQQKHSWPFQGLLSCGHCGCAMVAEIKKGKYVYYHCTGNKGKCPEKWVREEEVARQFGQAIGAIKMDSEILDWITRSLMEDQEGAKMKQTDRLTKLEDQYSKLQHRLDLMYEDKLDGRIDQEFYERKSTDWKQQQVEISRQILALKRSDQSDLSEGVQLLELAQRAVILYDQQSNREKRRILNFVCSNSTWKEGQLSPNYRQPFGIIAEKNKICRAGEAAFSTEKGNFEFWLPKLDSNQRPND